MVGGSRHGVVVLKHYGRVVRPSQLIASVRQTWPDGASDGKLARPRYANR